MKSTRVLIDELAQVNNDDEREPTNCHASDTNEPSRKYVPDASLVIACATLAPQSTRFSVASRDASATRTCLSSSSSVSDKRCQRRPTSHVTRAFAGSGSAFDDVMSTMPSTILSSRRTNLSSGSSPSRRKDVEHLLASGASLVDETRSPPRIKILDLHAEIESKPTLIDETSSSVLKYKTPQFKSHVTFQMSPIDDKQHWKIGWIQACTHMEFFSETCSNR
jgi:hypothetical protein